MESDRNRPKSRYDPKQGIGGISMVSFNPLALVNSKRKKEDAPRGGSSDKDTNQ